MARKRLDQPARPVAVLSLVELISMPGSGGHPALDRLGAANTTAVQDLARTR